METLGEHLKRRREEQGITLEEIESVTKISLSYLQDIEEDRFDSLPALIFTLGFLKQYALCIGLDPEDVILRYRLEVRKEGEDSPEGMPGQSWSMRRRAFWILLALVGGLVFLWLVLSPGDKRKEERVRSILFPRTTERELKKQQLREELNMGPRSSEEGRARADGTMESSQVAQSPDGFPDTGPVALTLLAVRETRVTVTLDGETTQSRLLQAGERVSWQANQSIQLEIGNGDAVRIFYQGEVYEQLGQEGEVVHIVFPPPST